MKQQRLVVLFCIAFTVFSAVFAAETGIKATFTQKGLNYLKDVGVAQILKELQVIDIPDLDGTTDTPIGHIEYFLDNMKLQNIQIPDAELLIIEGHGLAIQVDNFTAAVSLAWRYREVAWPHVSDHGTADAGVKTAHAFVELDIGRDDTGHPTVHTDNVVITIGKLDIKLHGGASWLYDIFERIFAGRIRESIVETLQENIQTAINTKMNEVLETFPLVEKLDDISEIDLSMTADPLFAQSYFTSSHKGEFYLQKNPQEAPYTANPMPDFLQADSMLELFISDYVFNTAGYVYAESGAIHFSVTADEVPPSSPFQLNTTSLKVFLPTLYARYPNKLVELEVFVKRAPQFIFNETEGVDAILYADITVNVVMDDGSLVEAFTMLAQIRADVLLKITNDNRVVGELSFMNVSLSITSSKIGPVSVLVIQNLMNLAMKMMIIPKVNQYLKDGFPLPIVAGLKLVNPGMGFGRDYVVIQTSIEYDPNPIGTDDGVSVTLL